MPGLASSTTKKVRVRFFDERRLDGYVSPQTYLRPNGAEILDRSAQVNLIPYEQIRVIEFIREFEKAPPENRRKVFAARPKSGGLWVRLHLRDGEVLEGILPNDLLQISDVGVVITPPDPNTNTQRMFVPRAALSELKVLGVIGSPVRHRRPKKTPPDDQIELFDKPGT